jgi:hypothetical protein
MSKIDQTVDEVTRIALAGLSLPLSEGPQPFSLVGDEAKFTPEDWAWLFLSMNSEYQDAYAARILEEAESPINQRISKLDYNEVKEDHDGSCALRFGLAAWLNPSAERLPKLSHERDSWFFPLTRPVAEDYLRQEVSEKKYVRTSPVFARHLDKYPHLVANETTFGYRRPLNTPSTPQLANDTFSITWVAIDCSIPPAGQITGLKALALANREALIQNGWKTTNRLDSVSIEDVTKNEVFEHMRFRKSSGAVDQSGNLEALWRAVQIDVLGPIVNQTTLLQKALSEVHDAPVAGKLATPPFRRFKNTLKSSQDNDGEFRNGGSYLKALHVIAELTQWGHDANSIARVTAINAEHGRHLHSWRRQFHEDLEKYIEEAQKMIEGGYKFLIHAQKPDPTNLD